MVLASDAWQQGTSEPSLQVIVQNDRLEHEHKYAVQGLIDRNPNVTNITQATKLDFEKRINKGLAASGKGRLMETYYLDWDETNPDNLVCTVYDSTGIDAAKLYDAQITPEGTSYYPHSEQGVDAIFDTILGSKNVEISITDADPNDPDPAGRFKALETIVNNQEKYGKLSISDESWQGFDGPLKEQVQGLKQQYEQAQEEAYTSGSGMSPG